MTVPQWELQCVGGINDGQRHHMDGERPFGHLPPEIGDYSLGEYDEVKREAWYFLTTRFDRLKEIHDGCADLEVQASDPGGRDRPGEDDGSHPGDDPEG